MQPSSVPPTPVGATSPRGAESAAQPASSLHHSRFARAPPCTAVSNDMGRTRAAYSVLYDIQARATHVVHEAAAALASLYGAVLNIAGSSNGAHRLPRVSSPRGTAAAAADVTSLLQRCTAMQTALRPEQNCHAETHETAKGLSEALLVLLTCLPSDWVPLLEETPEGSLSLSSWGAAKEGDSEAASAAASAAHRKRPSADGYRDSEVAVSAKTDPPAGVATCPSDVVQLALLLRRHWVLQHDLDLLVAALREVWHTTTADAAPVALSATAPQPPLSVVVALASLELSHMPMAVNAGAQCMQPEETGRQGGDRSAAAASPGVPPPSPVTVLPVWLWRASLFSAGRWAEATAPPCTGCTPPAAAAGRALPPLLPPAETTAAWGLARQRYKRIFKWEAHLTRYVNAALASPANASLCSQPTSQPNSAARRDAAKMHDSFLADVQAEMNAEHAACNEIELFWLAFALDIAANAAQASTGSLDFSNALVSERTRRRGEKVVRLLRALSPSSATARVMLPGVLLLLGGCSGVARRTSGSAVAPSTPQQCWADAFSIGRQVLGAAHPLVETVQGLLSLGAGAAASSNERLLPPQMILAALPVSYPLSGPTRLATSQGHAITPPSSPYGTGSPRPPPPPHGQQQHQHTPAAAALARLPPLASASSSLGASLLSPLHQQPRQSKQQPHPCGLFPPGTLPFRPLPLRSAPPQSSELLQSTSLGQPLQTPQRPTPPPLPQPRALQPMPCHGVAATKQYTPEASLHAHTFLLSANSSTAVAGAAAAATTPVTGRRSRKTIAGSHGGGAMLSGSSLEFSSKASKSLSLRHCYHLRNPEEALRFPDVAGAVAEPASGGAATPAKVAANAGKRKGVQKKLQNPTAALLLSAMPSKGGSSGDGSVDASRSGSDDLPHRRKKQDRSLLTLQVSSPTSAGSPVSSAHLSNGKRGGEGDVAVEAPLCTSASTSPTPSKLGSLSIGSAPKRIETVSPATMDPRVSVAGTGPFAFAGLREDSQDWQPTGDAAAAALAAPAAGEEEGEEEEEEETLPERNARFQREIIHYYAELSAQRARAALTIQLAWRSSRARLALHIRRQTLYRYVYIIQKAAALAIDGFLAGVLAQRRRTAALKARAAADAERLARERREVAAAQRLTRAARRWFEWKRERRRLCQELSIAHDAKLQLYAVKSVLIQQWWRRVVVEKAYWRRRTAEVAEQQRLQAELDRRLNAVTLLQARVRGMQTRREVRQYREAQRVAALILRERRDAAIAVLAIVLDEYALRQERLRREAAALKEMKLDAAERITLGWRKTLERRRFDGAVARARLLRTSASLIQKTWQRYAAGRQRRYLRQLRQTAHDERVEHEALTYTVARLLQCFARSASDQLLVRHLKARGGRTFIESVFLIQAVGRGALARRAAQDLHVAQIARQEAAAAAHVAQQQWCIALSQALLCARASAALVRQRRLRTLREKLMVRSTVKQEMREDAAAIALQRAIRRHQQRKRTAATAADAAWAMQYLTMMVCRVQRAWRCFAARRERQYRAALVLHCARKRVEREEVWHSIWRDQLSELDMICMLERHYIEEEQHAIRVSLYAFLGGPAEDLRGSSAAAPPHLDICHEYHWPSRRDVDVCTWAALYDE